MNFLLLLSIVIFLIATLLTVVESSAGKCYPATTNGVTQVESEPVEGDSYSPETSEGYRRRLRTRMRARKLRMKALRKNLAKKVRKVKKVKKLRKVKKVRKVMKKNKH